MAQDEEMSSLFPVFLLSILSLVTIPWTILAVSGAAERKKRELSVCPCSLCRTAKKNQRTIFSRISSFLSFRNVVLLLLWVAILILCFYLREINKEIAPFEPFSILGLSAGASDAEIKKAYRKLSLLYHPDKNPDPAANKYFVDFISKAYQALTDEVSRRNWEEYGHPDGRQSINVGVALPSFMLERQGEKGAFLLLGLVGVGILLPLLGAVLFLSLSQQYAGGGGVKNQTLALYYHLLKPALAPSKVFDVLTKAVEYLEMKVRAADVSAMQSLFPLIRAELQLDPKNLKQETHKFWKRQPSLVKTELLLLSHLCRVSPVPLELQKDFEHTMKMLPALLEELIKISLYPRNNLGHAWLRPVLGVIECSQCFYQAVPLSARKASSSSSSSLPPDSSSLANADKNRGKAGENVEGGREGEQTQEGSAPSSPLSLPFPPLGFAFSTHRGRLAGGKGSPISPSSPSVSFGPPSLLHHAGDAFASLCQLPHFNEGVIKKLAGKKKIRSLQDLLALDPLALSSLLSSVASLSPSQIEDVTALLFSLPLPSLLDLSLETQGEETKGGIQTGDVLTLKLWVKRRGEGAFSFSPFLSLTPPSASPPSPHCPFFPLVKKEEVFWLLLTDAASNGVWMSSRLPSFSPSLPEGSALSVTSKIVREMLISGGEEGSDEKEKVGGGRRRKSGGKGEKEFGEAESGEGKGEGEGGMRENGVLETEGWERNNVGGRGAGNETGNTSSAAPSSSSSLSLPSAASSPLALSPPPSLSEQLNMSSNLVRAGYRLVVSKFQAPPTPGTYSLSLLLLNDTYIGCDVKVPVRIKVLKRTKGDIPKGRAREGSDSEEEEMEDEEGDEGRRRKKEKARRKGEGEEDGEGEEEEEEDEDLLSEYSEEEEEEEEEGEEEHEAKGGKSKKDD